MRYRKRLNANIRAELARRDLLQVDVARTLGMSQKNVSARFTGKTEWKFVELLALSQQWELPLATLIDGTEDGPFEANGDLKAVTA